MLQEIVKLVKARPVESFIPDLQTLEEGERRLKALLSEDLDGSEAVDGSFIQEVRIDNTNPLSLNSLRATVLTAKGELFYFKAHYSPDENAKIQGKKARRSQGNEYYCSKYLEEAGFPIAPPVYASHVAGRQYVLHRYMDRKEYCELSALAAEIEQKDCPEEDVNKLSGIYASFQKLIGNRYVQTLHMSSAEDIAAEPFHLLFYDRLVDEDGAFGARVKSYYLDSKDFILPDGSTISFKEFWKLKWKINGIAYDSLFNAFEKARTFLKPEKSAPTVVAHGDDHPGNILCHNERMLYFDPAFAGRSIPALMAPCKAMYHTNFAHGKKASIFYEPASMTESVSVFKDGDFLHVNHDWEMTILRENFLNAQIEHVWIPLVKAMRQKEMLPENWEEIVRSTLFCCPVVCKNMLPGGADNNPMTKEASILNFAIAIMLAHPPIKKSSENCITSFFKNIKQALAF
jgi:hypothetical protein